jgi:hypothetical protein
MYEIEAILHSKRKPKEKVDGIINAIVSGSMPIEEFIEFFKSCSNVDKGNCADVMKHVSEKEPDKLHKYIGIIISYINYDAPRVKWGVQEAIGNLAEKYSEELDEAIPLLLKNTIESKKNTTVVRWCASYGITGIYKNNKKVRKELRKEIEDILRKENNNGVRKVYLNAIAKDK